MTGTNMGLGRRHVDAAPRQRRERLRLAIAIAIAVVAWLSFQFDALGIVSRGYFASQPRSSEDLVLDGILASQGADRPMSPLGRFARGGHSMPSAAEMRRNFDEKVLGRYLPYDSQYGLQGYFFGVLHDYTGASIDAMHAVNTGVLAVLVGLAFSLLAPAIGTAGAAAFAATALLSPWVVLFASDLYWVAWTWFLPMVITLAAATGRGFRSPTSTTALLAYGLAILIKLLCGYEYVTTIVIASFCPLFLRYRGGRPWLRPVLRDMFAFGLVSIAAFVIAIAAHAVRLEQSGTTAGSGDPVGLIRELAEKRLHSDDPEAIARRVCAEDFWEEPGCEKLFVESLNANPLRVIGRYVVGFRELLPWVSRWEETPPSDDYRDALLAAAAQPDRMRAVIDAAAQAPGELLPWIARALNTVVFVALVAAAYARVWRDRRTDAPLLGLLVTALAAPLSWFVAAKGHSYIHVTLNYVLWYLPFVPFACAVLLARRGRQNTD